MINFILIFIFTILINISIMCVFYSILNIKTSLFLKEIESLLHIASKEKNDNLEAIEKKISHIESFIENHCNQQKKKNAIDLNKLKK